MKRASAIVLIFATLLASLGLEMGIHKCGGKLMSMAFFKSAEPCAHAISAKAHKDLPRCHRHLRADRADNPKNCCEDEYYDLDILDMEVILDNSQWSTFLEVDFQTFIPRQSVATYIFKYVTPEYLNYKPPLIDADLRILKQVFLL